MKLANNKKQIGGKGGL